MNTSGGPWPVFEIEMGCAPASDAARATMTIAFFMTPL
jgi:hypothetical protein